MIKLLLKITKSRVRESRASLRQWLPNIFQPCSQKEANEKLPLFLLASFVISRIFFYLAGVQFDTRPFEGATHLMDVELLKTDMWQNLWYMHSQPPLFNLMTGLIFKITPDGYESIVAQPLFLLFGLFLCLGFYYFLKEMKIPARLAGALSFIFMISPPTIIFENWYMYSYPITTFVLWSAITLLWWGQGKGKKWLFITFILMFMITTFHPFFHLLWFYLSVITLVLISRKRRIEILLCAIIPLSASTGVYYKNYIQYGTFAASSWTALVANYLTNTFNISQEERKSLHATGEYSDLILFERSDLPFDQYPKQYQPKATGKPILDRVYKENGKMNHNHLGYIMVDSDHKKDALTTLQNNPEKYLGLAGDALFMYSLPITDYFHLPSKMAIFYWDWGYHLITTGRIGWSSLPVMHHLRNDSENFYQIFDGGFFKTLDNTPWYLIGWLQFLILPTLYIVGLLSVWKSLRKRESFDQTTAKLYIFYTVTYASVMAILFAIMENQRYRYYISPFLNLYFAYFTLWFSTKYRHKFQKPTNWLLDQLFGKLENKPNSQTEKT